MSRIIIKCWSFSSSNKTAQISAHTIFFGTHYIFNKFFCRFLIQDFDRIFRISISSAPIWSEFARRSSIRYSFRSARALRSLKITYKLHLKSITEQSLPKGHLNRITTTITVTAKNSSVKKQTFQSHFFFFCRGLSSGVSRNYYIRVKPIAVW